MSDNYKELARQARIKVLTMIHRAGTSHVASNFSVIDIATVLYQNLKDGDEVVWSKGWPAATIYYFLAQQGKIPKEDLEKFPNPPYLGLAETTVPGVHVSGGSMGHGLGVAVGMALGKKRAKETGTIYCIMSDGELNEGTTWEGAALAYHHKLNNLVVLIDANKWQAMGQTKDVLDFEPIEDRWMGFGWKAQRIDGHDYQQVHEALTTDFTEDILMKVPKPYHIFPQTVIDESYKYKPMVIICDTIKGKGVGRFEGHLLYHYKHVDDEEYKKALVELNS